MPMSSQAPLVVSGEQYLTTDEAAVMLQRGSIGTMVIRGFLCPAKRPGDRKYGRLGVTRESVESYAEWLESASEFRKFLREVRLFIGWWV